MWQNINPEKILFLDIETVPVAPSYDQLSSSLQKFWDKKSRYLVREDETPAELYERAGIYAEFGKVVCIGCGIFTEKDSKRIIRLKSFAGDDEHKILENFAQMLQRYYSSGQYLCAHNGKEFDFPYLARRMLINGIKLPNILNVSGMKPWETPFLDTLEFWKFGDYKHYTSLDLLAHLFDIPSPKDDMDGSMVAKVYWEEHNLSRIAHYCRADVLTLMQLFLRFRGEPLITPDCIEEVSDATV
ncbi:MAG: 3'-5' exonuclease [Bacteroidales bacterium]